MEEKITWRLSEKLIEYFASSIYGQEFSTIAVRELLQNALDSKAKEFYLRIDTEKDIQAINNGQPMDLETIRNVLFTLGESTKANGKDTGFFGVGECAVIAPCETWKIESGKYVIENFILKDNDRFVNGTVHTLTLRNPIYAYKLKEFLTYHNLPMKVKVRSYGYDKDAPRKHYRKCRKFTIPNGTFIWVKSGDCRTVIRVNGLPQSIENRYDNCGTWIIDLNTSTVLTVNREQIRNEETLKAVQAIQEHIRNVADHVSSDSNDIYLTINEHPLIIRKKGYVVRRDLTAKPIRKIYNCLKIVNSFFEKKLSKTIPVGLMFEDSDTMAMVHNGTIFINVEKRKMNPTTTFALKLMDDYTHELAHLTQDSQPHANVHTTLRYTIWENPKVITQIRNEVRTN